MKNYVIDPLHSEIGFKVKHMMISTVNGSFNKFTATMAGEAEDFSDAKINFECEVDSISTNITDRDAHLKSDDFFASHIWPKITFESTSIEKNEKDYTVKGLLTIRDVTKEISLHGNYNGSDVDLYGQTKHGFELDGVIKRSEFGLTFNMMSGKGNALVADDIKLVISIQMIEMIEAEQ